MTCGSLLTVKLLVSSVPALEDCITIISTGEMTVGVGVQITAAVASPGYCTPILGKIIGIHLSRPIGKQGVVPIGESKEELSKNLLYLARIQNAIEAALASLHQHAGP